MKKLDLDKNNQKFVINNAIRILKNGGVIVYPTETAYGLGADFFNPQAVKKVYQIKGRNYQKPLPVIVSSLGMAREVVKFNQKSLELARKYWPGPLTLVLEIPNSKFQIPKKIQNSDYKSQTLAVRISSNKLATAVVRKFGKPIIATSANISGKGECYSAAEVIKQFKKKKYQPDLIIDTGELPKRKVSTVVRVINDKVEVLRQGEIFQKS